MPGRAPIRAAALAPLALALLAGCPGKLKDPDSFEPPNPSPETFQCPVPGLNVETDIFLKRCGSSSCHSAAAAGAGLDLVSAGVARRLLGVSATGCAGKVLVNPALPPAGYFFDKMTETKPACGFRMPFGGTALTADELECVRAWVAKSVGSTDGGARDGAAGDGRGALPDAGGGTDGGAAEQPRDGAADAGRDAQPPVSGLPMPWMSRDLGAVGMAGSATHAAGTFTVKASGTDIWGVEDGFHFVYQPRMGNVRITARVASVEATDPWTKAGVMIRDTLDAGSKHALVVVTPGNGTTFQRRVATAGMSTQTAGAMVTAPHWVRVTRMGDSLTAETSADGMTWMMVGSETIPMAATAQVGLAVTAHNNAALTTATFGSVTVAVP